MARRMLIDASHPEETRVVVVDGTRLEEFDFETASRKPLKGNIYLAKVIRIEPSLQAAFVEYGGNRHGFLAFSEIHPDYYQIPVADRERLIAEQQRLHAEADEDPEPRRRNRVDRTDIEDARAEIREAVAAVTGDGSALPAEAAAAETAEPPSEIPPEAPMPEPEPEPAAPAAAGAQAAVLPIERLDGPTPYEPPSETPPVDVPTQFGEPVATGGIPPDQEIGATADDSSAPPPQEVTVEVLGGDDTGEERETRERRRRHPVRHYKIQEVIKRRQILLIQVVKEERGNKGAALTTYLSLAGRYCVLMPNAGRGGGISRKISNPADRKRMKDMLSQLEVPQGQGVILRTAGLERSNIDIKRDYEYLSRLWDSIREITMRSTAPALIYEEGDLIKRSLRDVYDTDIAQVLVEGEAGFTAASEFMRQLVPHQAAKVELYKEQIPLFHRYQVEAQFDAMHSPTVQLRSGGYIVINPTEALVAIDVNSGRSTKERNVEETAVRTNLEAAEEVARQVRLRDLAGLIVIDFIDMDETRHQRQVEHKVKDAMRTDRARIQIGRISAFGLLEMSRQRLRPSLLEHSTEICPHCAGSGRIRSIESASLHALRAIEEEGVRRRASEIAVSVPPNVALYLLNQKRHTLSEIEKRYGFTVLIEADEDMHAADCEIERVRSRRGGDERPGPELARASYDVAEGEAPAGEAGDHEASGEGREGEPEGDRFAERVGERGEGRTGERTRERAGERSDEDGSGPRRRRRRGGRRDDDRPDQPHAAGNGATEEYGANGATSADGPAPNGAADHSVDGEPVDAPDVGERGPDARPARADGERGEGDGRRRRGRRGGRRRRRENGEGDSDHPPREQASERAPQDETSWDRPAELSPAAANSEPVPMEGTPVERMPLERAPYDPAPPAAVNIPPPPPPAPPPPPVYASAPQPTPEPPPPPAIPAIQADAPPEKPKRGWWRR